MGKSVPSSGLLEQEDKLPFILNKILYGKKEKMGILGYERTAMDSVGLSERFLGISEVESAVIKGGIEMGIMLGALEKSFIKGYLEKFDAAPFRVIFEDGDSFLIGDGVPKFEVVLHGELQKQALLQSTSLALGEAYMDGILEIKGDLYEALRLFMKQMGKFTTNTHALRSILMPSASRRNQKNEVQSHYDIGNDFYSLWLDDTMSYSCAYFQKEEDTLYKAQMHKVHYILKKLNLKEGMSLLDIGCGWGFLLIEAAKKYGITGTGITLSEQQFEKAKKRICSEGLEDKISVELMDYRDLERSGARFDRVVSVGMLEHVGRQQYPLFMRSVDAVLKEEGLFLLHFISGMTEQEGDPFIKKYIFPGGVIPSLREILYLCGEMEFFTLDVESLRRHYVKTLLQWNTNFQQKRTDVRKLFDERFVRMWELYLLSCASAFENGIVDIHQLLLSKGVNQSVPLTRKYLYQ